MRGIVGWGRAGGVCSVCSCSAQCLRSQSQGWWEGGGLQPLSQILGVGALGGPDPPPLSAHEIHWE